MRRDRLPSALPLDEHISETDAGADRRTVELSAGDGSSANHRCISEQPDADLDLAAQRCAVGGYGYSGQSCISVQRVFVHHTVYDRFVERFLARVGALKSGDPFDEATVVGPLINEAAARRVEDWIGEAVAQGARLLAGGKRSGSLVEPTVLADVTPTMKVSCREVFGPVVTVTRYTQFEEALEGVAPTSVGA